MTVFETVRTILAKQLEIDPETISGETRIVEDLGADSLDIVELIMALEESFNIMIDNNEAAELSTIAKVVAYIESRL